MTNGNAQFNEIVMLSSPDYPLVLVTGSAGLIGSRTIAALSKEYSIVGLDVKPPKAQGVGDWIECDLTNEVSVQQALEQVRRSHGSRIASVIHLAAYYDFAGRPSELYDELTVNGTRRLLEQLQGFQVEQFIFSSSLLVLRAAETGELLNEDSPTEATWDYPNSKLAAEEVIKKFHREIPVVILRIAGVYDEDGHSIPIGQQIRRIHEKQLESYFFPGDADHGQAFVHLDDLIACVRTAIERRHSLGPYETFLVAEPDVMSYEELQDLIGQELHGQEWPTFRIPKTVAKAGAWVKDKLAGENDETFIKPWMVDLADAHYPVDPSRARQLLGWEPRRRLRTTLPEMLRRLKQDPNSWYETQGFPTDDGKGT